MADPDTIFPKLPTHLVALAPVDKAAWRAGLIHGLDIALRLDLGRLGAALDGLPAGQRLATVRLPVTEELRQRLRTLRARSGWSERRAVTAGLVLALADRYSPLYAAAFARTFEIPRQAA